VVAPPRLHGDALARGASHDHAVNVLTGGPPPWLGEAIGAAELAAYPDEGEAVTALAELHGRDRAEIVPLSGSTQGLWLLAPALRPRLAAIVEPAFAEAGAALEAHGIPLAHAERRPETAFALDAGAVDARADLVVVGNPGSPDGVLHDAQRILALRRPGRTLVVDEVFIDMVPGEPQSLARERLDGVVVLRSVTKSMSLAGLRAGYAIAPRALADRLRAVRAPWSVSAPALAALTAVAQRPGALAQAAERAQAERADLERRLAVLDGTEIFAGAANWCLVRLDDAAAALARLAEAGIAVRPCGSFHGLGDEFIRITARDPRANAHLVSVLARRDIDFRASC
jgi:histidinol-phosphate/aromatic aminotransferase/cobyric acid decarboxylase-like protein